MMLPSPNSLTANSNFDTDVSQDEERHDMYRAKSEDLFVLVHAFFRFLRLFVRLLTDFSKTV